MDKRQKKKLKRTAKKKKEKALAQDAQNKIKKQMIMFGRRPDECSACDKEFPMTREAHMSWQVVTNNEQGTVRLFCPDCLEKAKTLLEDNNE